MKKYKMKTKWQYVIVAAVISTILVLLLDYIWPSPWNLKSMECWFKLMVVFVIDSFILPKLI